MNEKGYSKDIDRSAPDESGKTGILTGGVTGAAVLALAFSFGQAVSRNIQPDDNPERSIPEETMDRTPAQTGMSPEEIAKYREMERVCMHIYSLYRNIFTKGEYIATRRETQYLGIE